MTARTSARCPSRGTCGTRTRRALSWTSTCPGACPSRTSSRSTRTGGWWTVATEVSVETRRGEEKQKRSARVPQTKPGHPVALFIHGVWAVGEKWQFAPMAHRLAEEGGRTRVATYSLFPRRRRSRMWEEVSDAPTFTMDNAARPPGRVRGARWCPRPHPAPARPLCAMAPMHVRALATTEPDRRRRGYSTPRLEIAKTRRRRRVGASTLGSSAATVGQAAYDIDTHYKYETRGVAPVSTMARDGRATGSTARRPCGWCCRIQSPGR